MAQIEWAIIDGNRTHISELNPAMRPRMAVCLKCEQELIPKLGNERRWHFAHRPDSICVLTNPETALHFNKKWEWAKQLEQDRELILRERCKQCHKELTPYPFLSDIGMVKVEYPIGVYVADVAAFSLNGSLIGIIEIVVTHEMTPDKRRYLENVATPYLEVDAHNNAIIHCHPSFESTCFDCRVEKAKRRLDSERLALQRERSEGKAKADRQLFKAEQAAARRLVESAQEVKLLSWANTEALAPYLTFQQLSKIVAIEVVFGGNGTKAVVLFRCYETEDGNKIVVDSQSREVLKIRSRMEQATEWFKVDYWKRFLNECPSGTTSQPLTKWVSIQDFDDKLIASVSKNKLDLPHIKQCRKLVHEFILSNKTDG